MQFLVGEEDGNAGRIQQVRERSRCRRQGLADEAIVEVGRLGLEAIATPGHTPDSFWHLPACNQHGLPSHDAVPTLPLLTVDDVGLGPLPDAAIPERPVATRCGTTDRAMTAASVLERLGHREVAVPRGGCSAWTAHQPAPANR